MRSTSQTTEQLGSGGTGAVLRFACGHGSCHECLAVPVGQDTRSYDLARPMLRCSSGRPLNDLRLRSMISSGRTRDETSFGRPVYPPTDNMDVHVTDYGMPGGGTQTHQYIACVSAGMIDEAMNISR
jgi:hypothetical protein